MNKPTALQIDQAHESIAVVDCARDVANGLTGVFTEEFIDDLVVYVCNTVFEKMNPEELYSNSAINAMVELAFDTVVSSKVYEISSQL